MNPRWIARSLPPADLRAEILHAGAEALAVLLVLLLVGVVAVSAPAVRVVLASQRLLLLRSLPLSHGWWQRRHALHLAIVNLRRLADSRVTRRRFELGPKDDDHG